MTQRRADGLCYNCDEKFVAGHQCKKLFVIEVVGFDDVNMAQRTGVRLLPCPNFSVTVANGDQVASPGKALAQSVNIGNEAFDIDFYALPLGAYDMVLGVQWLSSLGPILWDFAKHTMCFTRAGRPIT
jgi:hypothetical protein